MFLVFNKQKIFSYFIAFTTVAILLGIANIYNSRLEETLETTSKEVVNSMVISDSMETEDIENVAEIMKKNNINVRFYYSKEWKQQHESTVKKMVGMGFEMKEYKNE